MIKKLLSTGKRKRAVARASIKQGSGIVRVNKMSVNVIKSEMLRLKVNEPLILAGDIVNKVDIDVSVLGGGISSQADASRLAIAKALVDYTKNDQLKETFLNYDRNMLVADVRRKEPAKPNRHGQARAKVQKSYR